jgi:hypothetical protein
MLFCRCDRAQKPNRPNPTDNIPRLMKHPLAKASGSPESLIPAHGGYRKLKSFQLAQLCFDVTVRFCNRHVDKRDRTHDQMVQAARGGKQNIAEGSKISGTSKKTELKLTNVARAGLEETSARL